MIPLCTVLNANNFCIHYISSCKWVTFIFWRRIRHKIAPFLQEAPELDALLACVRIPLDADVNTTSALLSLLIANLAGDGLALLQWVERCAWPGQ